MSKHRTLKRQLKKFGLDEKELPDDPVKWKLFLQRVSEIYTQNDEERVQTNHTLDVLSKEMQERYEALQEMNRKVVHNTKLASLGSMSSGIAHELNNPLGALRGFVQLMQKKYDREKAAKYLEKMLSICDRMSATVSHLRNLAYNSSRKDWKKIPVREPVQNAIMIVQQNIDAAKIALSVDYDQADKLINGDAYQIESVIQNLLVNSIDSFEEKAIASPEIKIRFLRSAREITFSYEDNAGGIGEDIINKVFDPFFTTKSMGKGTGLGLAICKQILTDHEATITIESDHKSWTRFVVTFPMAEAEIEDSQKTVRASSDGIRTAFGKIKTTHKVLLVDDDKDLLFICKEMLGEHFALDTCDNVAEARKHMEKEDYHAIVTDLKMAPDDGISLIKHIRTELDSTVPIVVISGHANYDPDLERAMESGGDVFVPKPFPSYDHLRDTVNELIKAKAKIAI